MRLSALSPTLFPLILSLLSGCSPKEEPAQQQQPSMVRDYHQDAKPILDRYCNGCHSEGGIGHFSLASYSAAKTYSSLIKSQVDSGDMPPWPPAGESLPLRYSRQMAPQDKQILLDWVKDGAQEGDPNAKPRVVIAPPEVPQPPRADFKIDMGLTYQPNKKLSDDYRCFVIDPNPSGTGGMPEDAWVRAGIVKPGNDAIDHHVIVFVVPPANAAAVKKKDTDEAGPGYTCLGGPGTNNASFLIGWAPGGVGVRLPESDGMPVKKGSIFVMQVHYNVHNDNGKGDRTVAELEITKTPPQYLVYSLPFANPDQLKIPAGDADAVQYISVPVGLVIKQLKLPGNELTIQSVTPHMHLLGTQITTMVGNQPLVHIPKWKFHWQQSYLLQEPFVAKSDQILSLECHYNNSADNQPVIGGVKQTPRDVTWGEGTEDEMCLSFIGIRVPRQPTP
ncbi:MAG: hypothetical protein U0745_04355 [Polyangia bacterium]|jgi:hypothetical protein